MKGLTFNETMLRAWLEGRKTVTRILMKPQPAGHPWEYNPSHRLEHTMLLTNKGWYCKFWHQIAQTPLPDREQWIRAPYQPGETVYIKEAWALIGAVPHTRELGIRHRQGAQDIHWRVVDQCIFDRYTKIIGPGEYIMLRTWEGNALFVWRKFIDGSGQQGINCAVFRNESCHRSSDLIRQADAVADCAWPGERHYTYINARKIRSTNPGCCFKAAGWRCCGRTKGGLVILERTKVQEQGK